MKSVVKHLDVSYNYIGRKGLECLVESFKVVKNLEYLGLASNGLTCYNDV